MKMAKLLAVAGVAALSALLGTGCSTTVGYRDAGEATTLTRDFSRADLQQSVMSMVDSMLANPVLQRKLGQQFPDRYPTISIPPGALKNETYQMGLNLASLTDSIRTKLINSGVFEFVDVQADAMLQNEMQRDMVMGASSDVIETGQQAVADYILYGTLTEMRESAGRTKESYYKLTMQLVNKKTGRMDWADEKEIRKQSQRPVFGL